MTFTDGQQITQSWNAAVSSSGATVTARSESYNGPLAPGATATFGFVGTRSGTTAGPGGDLHRNVRFGAAATRSRGGGGAFRPVGQSLKISRSSTAMRLCLMTDVTPPICNQRVSVRTTGPSLIGRVTANSSSSVTRLKATFPSSLIV